MNSKLIEAKNSFKKKYSCQRSYSNVRVSFGSLDVYFRRDLSDSPFYSIYPNIWEGLYVFPVLCDEKDEAIRF